MKQKLCAGLCVVIAAGLFTACGASKSFEADEDTVYVTKKGDIIGASVEDFSEEYYDEEELKAYITESVDDYVDTNGSGSVKLERFSVTDDESDKKQAQLYLSYADSADYAGFNGVTMYTGTVLEAQAAGYKFDQKFHKVEAGKITDAVEAETFLDMTDAKVVILGQEILLKLDGELMYVSDDNTEVTGKNTVKVHFDIDEPNAEPAYVIYSEK